VKQFHLLTNTNFDVMGKKFLFISISAVAVVASLLALFTRGLNWGVDFRGGTEVRVRFLSEPSVEKVRKDLEALGIGEVDLQRIGKAEDHELLIRIGQGKGAQSEGGLIGSSDVSQKVLSALATEEDRSLAAGGKIDLNQASAGSLETWLARQIEAAKQAGTIPADSQVDARASAEAIIAARDAEGGLFRNLERVQRIPTLSPVVQTFLKEGTFIGQTSPRSVEYVGPSAGRDLIRKATWAVIGSNVGILIYIWIRFRFIWGIAGVVALFHDVIVAMGALALTQKEFTLPVVAALLTIVGYSIADTVVVLDRIRENLRIYRNQDFERVVNASINQTFSRTILTQFTVMLCTTALYLYGGDRMDALSFTLLVGFAAGAYSSVFVASPILVLHQRWWNERRRRRA
jgi:preprotein translocase subunit SecF